MQHKLKLLKMASHNLCMTMHPSKSRFLTISTDDRDAFTVDEVSIFHTEEYFHLGTLIINDIVLNQVKRHLVMKVGNLLKFSSFMRKSKQMPYIIKNKVCESAINTALFYG